MLKESCGLNGLQPLKNRIIQIVKLIKKHDTIHRRASVL